MRSISSTLALAGFLCLAIGCGGGGQSSVGGKVTLSDGSPAVGATVNFENLEKHTRSTGITNDAGDYQLSTSAKNDGAPPGDYRVTVHQPLPADSSETVVTRIFPDRYEKPDTSTLQHTVTSGSNKYDIRLEAQ